MCAGLRHSPTRREATVLWRCSSVRVIPGWAAIDATPDPAASSLRWSSRAKTRSASLLCPYSRHGRSGFSTKRVKDALFGMTYEHVEAFATVLRGVAFRFMRIAGAQSTAHRDFSKQELLTLGILGIREPRRMGEIAEHLGVGQSAMTPLVDRLESQRLVERRRSDEDRRVWLVGLTERGREIVAAEDRVYLSVAREMLAPLDPGERATLVALLERVAAAEREGAGA